MATTGTMTKDPKKISTDTEEVQTSRKRLEILLAENAAYADSISKNSPANAKLLASAIADPVSTENAVARLGLLTGLIPTTAILVSLLIGGPPNERSAFLAIFLLFSAAIAATSAAGYYSGKLVGRMLSELENKEWPIMLFALPFIGIVWGLFSGALGGIVILGIGAVFGAAIGAIVAPLVLTVFGILHRLLKTGDVIERSRFLPIAFGITLTAAAFILGFWT